MKLIEFKRKYDFGHEFVFCILRRREWALFQLSLDFNDYGGWPYFQLSSGMGRAICFLLTIWRLGVSFDIAGYAWPDFYEINYDFDEEDRDLG